MSDLSELIWVRKVCANGTARKLRTQARLTLAEVGEAVRVYPSTIYYWEVGSRVPRGVAALRYAEILRLLEQEVGEV